MGCHPNIGLNKFPTQSEWLNLRTKVCFNYSSDEETMGTIIRDDDEEPFTTLIKLDDGRIVDAKECQYSPCV